MKEINNLLKRIRILHNKLPTEFQQLGNNYLEQEFKLFQQSNPSNPQHQLQQLEFIKEWNNYYNILYKQLHPSVEPINALKPTQDFSVGQDMSPETLKLLSPEQLLKLQQLAK